MNELQNVFAEFLKTGNRKYEIHLTEFRQDLSIDTMIGSLDGLNALIQHANTLDAAQTMFAVFLAQCVRQKASMRKVLESVQTRDTAVVLVDRMTGLMRGYQAVNTVINQLCLAFNAILLRVHSLYPLQEALTTISSALDLHSNLRVIGAMPEQATRKKFLKPQENCDEFMRQVGCGFMLQIVERAFTWLDQDDMKTVSDDARTLMLLRVCECLHAWLDVNWLSTTNVLAARTVFPRMLGALVDSHTQLDSLGPVIVDVAWVLGTDAFGSLMRQEAQALENLHILLSQTLSLKNRFFELLSDSTAQAVQQCLYLNLVFASITRAMIPVLMQGIAKTGIAASNFDNPLHMASQELLTVLLQAARHPEPMVASVVFDVWIAMHAEVHNHGKLNTASKAARTSHAMQVSVKSAPAANSRPEGKTSHSRRGKHQVLSREEKLAMSQRQVTYTSNESNALRPFLIELVKVLIDQSCYRPDFLQQPPDARDSFRLHFRNDIRDVLRAVVSSPMVPELARHAHSILTEELSRDIPSWQRCEGALHGLTPLNGAFDSRDPGTLQLVGQMMVLLPSLPKHPELRCTACLLVRVYAAHLQALNHDDVFAAVVRVIGAGLEHPEGGTADDNYTWDMREGQDHTAAVGLYKLTLKQKNQQIPQPFAAYIARQHPLALQMAETFMVADVNADQSGTMGPRSEQLMLAGLGAVVSAMTDVTLRAEVFNALFQQLLARIQYSVTNAQIVLNTVEGVNSLSFRIKALAQFASGVYGAQGTSQLLISALGQAWLLLNKLATLSTQLAAQTDVLVVSTCELWTEVFQRPHPTSLLLLLVKPITEQLGQMLIDSQAHPAPLSSLYALSEHLAQSKEDPRAVMDAQVFTVSAVVMFLERVMDWTGPDCKVPEERIHGTAFVWFRWVSMLGDSMPLFLAEYPDVLTQVITVHLVRLGLCSRDRQAGGAALKLVQRLVGPWIANSSLRAPLHTLLVTHGNGSLLVRLLINAVRGAMPHFMLNNIMDALWDTWLVFGVLSPDAAILEQTLFAKWLAESLELSQDNKKGFHFYREFLHAAGRKDRQKVKRLLKNHCGGKKTHRESK